MTLERPMFPPAREIETIEPGGILETYCGTLVRVDHLGPCRRLVFSVLDFADAQRPYNAVVAKMIVPAEAIPAIVAQLLKHAPADASVTLAIAERDSATAH